MIPVIVFYNDYRIVAADVGLIENKGLLFWGDSFMFTPFDKRVIECFLFGELLLQ